MKKLYLNNKLRFIYAGAVIVLVAASIFLYNINRNSYLHCSGEYDDFAEGKRERKHISFYMEIDKPFFVKIYKTRFFIDWYARFDAEFGDNNIWLKEKYLGNQFPFDNLRLDRNTLKLYTNIKYDTLKCEIVKKQKRKL